MNVREQVTGARYSTAVRVDRVDAYPLKSRHDPPCQEQDADLWFADVPAQVETAKQLCGECPARLGCLAGAIARQESAGVWGGELFHRGMIIATKRARGRPRKVRKIADRKVVRNDYRHQP
jgi:WhiB family redox-sensing transcriptional regulator